MIMAAKENFVSDRLAILLPLLPVSLTFGHTGLPLAFLAVRRKSADQPTIQPASSMAELRARSDSPPKGWRWRSHTLFISSTVTVGIFTDLFLYGLIVPVLPFMLQERLKIPEDEIQSYVDEMLALYAGGSVIFAPMAGFLADHMPSRQLPFLCGLAALFAATVLLGVGETIPVLYIARLLQGLSTGVVWPVGLALMVDTVGARNLGAALGSMFAFATAGALIAPTVGGSLYTYIGYYGVIAIGGAVVVVDFIMRLIMIEQHTVAQYIQTESGNVENESENQRGDDNEQGASSSVDETSPLLRTSCCSNYEIPSQQSTWFRRFPFVLCLRTSSMLSCLLVILVQGAMYGSFDATLPIFTNEVFGFNSSQAGLMFICLGATDMMSGPIMGRMVDLYGTKIMATVANVFLAVGLILLRLVTHNTVEQIVLYSMILGLCGIGLGSIFTPAMVEGSIIVQRYYELDPPLFKNRPPYAQLYGLQSTMYMAGLTGGPLLAGKLKSVIGYGNMTTTLAGICAASALIAWLYLGIGRNYKG